MNLETLKTKIHTWNRGKEKLAEYRKGSHLPSASYSKDEIVEYQVEYLTNLRKDILGVAYSFDRVNELPSDLGETVKEIENTTLS
jgi:carbohydrate-binding DOMON domain-containing protein